MIPRSSPSGADWMRVRPKWPEYSKLELWTNGEAVLDTGLESLGARDEDALARAAVSLGIIEDVGDLPNLEDFVASDG